MGQVAMDTAPETPYARFLYVANEAHKWATCEQRRLIRQLAQMHLSPEENTRNILLIMGWEE